MANPIESLSPGRYVLADRLYTLITVFDQDAPEVDDIDELGEDDAKFLADLTNAVADTVLTLQRTDLSP